MKKASIKEVAKIMKNRFLHDDYQRRQKHLAFAADEQ